MTKFKAKVTFNFEYEVDLKHYGYMTCGEAIELDEIYFADDPLEFLYIYGEHAKTEIEILRV